MSNTTWIIKNWMGKAIFSGKQFSSFDEAWDHIYTEDPPPPPAQDHPDNDNWYDDYYVEPVQ